MKKCQYENFKENQVYGLRKSSSKFLIKQANNQASQTQSLFSSKKNSLKNITNQHSVGISDFCQTLSSGFGMQWTRPQSKHASRRQSNRPQTSKGPRGYGLGPYGQSKQRSSDIQLTKSPFPSKSMYNCANQTDQKHHQLQYRKPGHRQDYDEGERENQDEDIGCSKNVKIVVTRSQRPRKERSIYNDKFQTNLPEEFLGLFAD